MDVARARAVLEEVLSRDEFRQHAETPFARLRQQIADWLMSVWERIGGTGVAGESVTTALAWFLAIAALGALLVWLFRSLAAANKYSGLALTAPATSKRSARAWALAAARATDPREAVRCAYSAAVARLEEEGAWKSHAALTPREHLRLLAPDHRRRPPFADVMRRFEDAWFAARPPTDDDTRAVLARLRELGCLPAD